MIIRLVERQMVRGLLRVGFQDRRLKRSDHEVSAGAMGCRVEEKVSIRLVERQRVRGLLRLDFQDRRLKRTDHEVKAQGRRAGGGGAIDQLIGWAEKVVGMG